MTPSETSTRAQPHRTEYGPSQAQTLTALQALARATDRLLEVVIVTCLVLMVVLVFLNVVLRYVLNSGIGVSDELARMLFIWLTFFGAILGLRRRQHVGVTMLRDALSSRGRWMVDAACEGIIVLCSILLVQGAWKFALLNHDNLAPATGLPMSLVYGIGAITGLGFVAISGARFVGLLLTGDHLPTTRAGRAPLDIE